MAPILGGLALPKPGQASPGDSFLMKAAPPNHHHQHSPGLEAHQLWLQRKLSHGQTGQGSGGLERGLRAKPSLGIEL